MAVSVIFAALINHLKLNGIKQGLFCCYITALWVRIQDTVGMACFCFRRSGSAREDSKAGGQLEGHFQDGIFTRMCGTWLGMPRVLSSAGTCWPNTPA